MELDSIFRTSLANQLVEIFNGPPGQEAFLLNPGDPGLLDQLESISAQQASSRPFAGKTTIAAHVDHIQYGLSLLNRWADGEENPWATADWDASWRRTTVDENRWRTLRTALRLEFEKWRRVVETRADWNLITASGALASASHTAYHLGAIRQILAAVS